MFDSGPRLIVRLMDDEHLEVTFADDGAGFGCTEHEANVLIEGLRCGVSELAERRISRAVEQSVEDAKQREQDRIEPPVRWRGSVSDLVTDLRCVFNSAIVFERFVDEVNARWKSEQAQR